MALLKKKPEEAKPITNTRYPRRYVGRKETVAYILEDTAQSLNISDFYDRYIYDVVKINFNFLAIQNLIATIWDIINDTFIGVIVERTRTRWGKFRPYVLIGKVPLAVIGCWYWLIPFIFPNTAGDFMPKWIFYFVELSRNVQSKKTQKHDSIFLDFLSPRQCSTADGGLPLTGCRQKCYNPHFRRNGKQHIFEFPSPSANFQSIFDGVLSRVRTAMQQPATTAYDTQPAASLEG